jgi:hypothetical protein
VRTPAIGGRTDGGGGSKDEAAARKRIGRGGNEVTPHPTALRRNSRATQGPALAGVKAGYSRPTGYFRTKSGNSRPRLPNTGIVKYEILGMQVRETKMLGFR